MMDRASVKLKSVAPHAYTNHLRLGMIALTNLFLFYFSILNFEKSNLCFCNLKNKHHYYFLSFLYNLK